MNTHLKVLLLQCQAKFGPNQIPHLELCLQMVAGFINILCMTNNIQIIYVYQDYAKSSRRSSNEHTWAIIAIRVSFV
jgi:hypothetical protein